MRVVTFGYLDCFGSHRFTPLNGMEDAMGQMYRLDDKGHTLVEWDTKDEESTAKAAITFNEIVGKGGAIAFKTIVKDGVKKSEMIRTFDPTAEKIVLAPQMRGG